jgi:regulator of protease activity HflC (stomatin/prohibitin superfamily)
MQLPDSMQRAMARQAEAEREKRAKIIAAEGEALAAGELARAADVMAAHPLALQLRNLQTLVEVAVDKNSTELESGQAGWGIRMREQPSGRIPSFGSTSRGTCRI